MKKILFRRPPQKSSCTELGTRHRWDLGGNDYKEKGTQSKKDNIINKEEK